MKKLSSYLFAATILLSVFLPLNVMGQAEEGEAEDEGPAYTSVEEFQSLPLEYPKFMVDNLWILIAAALVFIMHLGFSTLETGLTRQKNTVNVLFKNVFIICSGILLYAVWGFNAMYPGDWTISNIFAFGSPLSGTPADNADTVSYTHLTLPTKLEV